MPAAPRVLVLSCTAEPASPSAALAFEIARRLAISNCDATALGLADYPLPVLDWDAPRSRPVPREAVRLAERFELQDAVVLAAPLANGSLAPLAKNAVDWIERAGGGADRQTPFRGLLVALAAAGTPSREDHGVLAAWRPVIEALGGQLLAPALAVPAEAGSAPGMSQDMDDALDGFVQMVVARASSEGRRLY